MRIDGRENNQLRPINFELDYLKFAKSSALVSYGDTKVIVTASVEEGVPPFLEPEVSGWITAEYGMLPASCSSNRIKRPGKTSSDGRTKEIQRLIGRSLRTVIDLESMPGITVIIDCDVIQGDGGTRTASISGASFVCYDLFEKLKKEGLLEKNPLKELIGSVSVGIVENEYLLDLCYEEDFKADVDMNVVMTESGKFVEIMASGEKNSFSKNDFFELLNLAENGINNIINLQKKILSL